MSADETISAARVMSMAAPPTKPKLGVVVMAFEPPRFAIEIWRAWRNEWAVLEYAVDLKTAARRAELLTRKEDAPTRIIDRKPE